MTQNGDAAVRLVGARKSYGDVVAVDGIDLEIAADEFFTMLGPSGSGKTTCLRMIAGFERPDEGRVELDGREVTRVPPFERDVNTVFQDYALFPHMSVGENVGYGLKIKKIGRDDRRSRVAEALEMVRLDGYEERRPGQLSGGQRQRVALARALVNRPRVLLLDEPLGALDLKLRQQMQHELRTLQGEVGITFIYVTHDQEEALTMSDRLAVFNDGRVEQVGAPADVYERPVNEFVAGFVGVSNVVERDGTRFTIRPEKVRMLEGLGGRSRRAARRGGAGPRCGLHRGDHPLRGRSRPRRRAAGRPAEPRDVVAAGARAAGSARASRLARRARVRHPGLAGIKGGGTVKTHQFKWWIVLAVVTLALAALTAAGCGERRRR